MKKILYKTIMYSFICSAYGIGIAFVLMLFVALPMALWSIQVPHWLLVVAENGFKLLVIDVFVFFGSMFPYLAMTAD